MTDAATGTVRASVQIAAAVDDVWALVSDLPRMGEFSPENRGGRWVGGSTGAALGAVFRGANGRGVRRWSTRSRVVRCDPGRAFAFDVSFAGRPVARWSYELEPTGEGCRLTETWQDRRGRSMRLVAGSTTGVGDRTAFTVRSIEHTLARVKSVAEGTSGHTE